MCLEKCLKAKHQIYSVEFRNSGPFHQIVFYISAAASILQKAGLACATLALAITSDVHMLP